MSLNSRSIAPLCSHSTAIATIRAALVYLDGPTLTQIGGEELDAALKAVVEAS